MEGLRNYEIYCTLVQIKVYGSVIAKMKENKITQSWLTYSFIKFDLKEPMTVLVFNSRANKEQFDSFLMEFEQQYLKDQ